MVAAISYNSLVRFNIVHDFSTFFNILLEFLSFFNILYEFLSFIHYFQVRQVSICTFYLPAWKRQVFIFFDDDDDDDDDDDRSNDV